jgi:abortive infection Abi-like protein
MGEIISKKTRSELAEHMSGMVLREIEREFDAVNIECDRSYDPQCSGQRRTFARQYLHSLDFTKDADARKFLALCDNMLNSAAPDSYFAKEFPKWLRKDGFVFENGRIASVAQVTSLANVRAIALEFDANHMQELIGRMASSVDTDPALAIGSAKELIETCCKTILAERGKPAKGTEDVLELVKATRAELKLLPDDVPNAAKGSDTIKRLLNNLATVAQGLAELRGLYGTGHGRDGKTRGVKPRHARLAVNAASALAVFLFETHKDLTP